MGGKRIKKRGEGQGLVVGRPFNFLLKGQSFLEPVCGNLGFFCTNKQLQRIKSQCSCNYWAPQTDRVKTVLNRVS